MTVRQYNYPTTIKFGPGASKLLPDLLKGKKLSRPLLLSDAGLAPLPTYAKVKALLVEGGLAVGEFYGFQGNPIEAHVKAGVAAYKAHNADCIVALGGGAPLDVAKVVALMAHHPGDLFDYEDGKPDARPVDQHFPFVVAIPTTAGTGSEVGRSSVISDDVTKAKKIIFDPRFLPPVALLDPELTTGLPAKVTAATGIDALTHCVEAFLARGFHPMADGIALEGCRLVAKSLRRCVTHPDDLEARGEMLLASAMGATAFQKGLGVTHSLAHPLSSVCDMHHGLANAIMIPYAMRFNAPHVPEQMARLAQAVGAKTHDAEGFIAWLEDLQRDLNIPPSLKAAGVDAKHLDELVRFAVVDPCHPSNPVDVSEADFRALFLAAL
jgi:alcohol dehydrogenase class IV